MAAPAAVDAATNNIFEALPDPENILSSFVDMKKACIPYYDKEAGKQYFVKLVALPNARASRTTVRDAVRSFTQLYGADTFVAVAPDGIYTWIVSDAGFLAARVLSLFELGTLHKQLATFLGATKVFVAGECEKKGGTVELNLQSGTFTLKIIERREANTSIPDRLKARAKKVFEDMGFSSVSLLREKTLIRDEKTPVSREELALYKAAGFEVELYEDKDNCFKKDIYTAQGRITHFIAAIKDAKRSIKKLEEMERSGNSAAKWFKRAPEELEAAEKELVKWEKTLEKAIQEHAAKRILFGGGGGQSRTSRSSRKNRQPT